MGSTNSDEQTQNVFLKKLCSSVTLQSQKEGFFNKWASQIIGQLNQEFVNKFGSLQNDKDRVSMIWKEQSVHSLDIHTIFTGKNQSFSAQKRQEGNKAFQAKENEKSLLLYTQAVMRAPTAGDDLSLSFANRSAVLFHLSKYALCLQDIQLAISYNYPQRIRYKVLDRKGECLIKLESFDEAKSSFEEAFESLSKSDLEDSKREVWISNLKRKIAFCDQSRHNIAAVLEGGKQGIPGETFLEDLHEGNSEVLPMASSVLGLKCTQEAGRFMVTTEDLPTAKCLIREFPFSSVLRPEKRGMFCEHCFKRLIALVPCETCSGIAFCSPQCRDIAQSTYHKWECHFLGLFAASGMSLNCSLALRVITERGLTYFKKIESEIEDHVKGTKIRSLPSKDSPYQPDDYLSFYNLVSLESQRDVLDFLQRTLMAIFLLKVLQKSEFFPTFIDGTLKLSEDELLIGSLILRHLQVIQFNAHEVSGFIFEGEYSFKKSRSIHLGLGVYPTASFLNHSCYPAVGRYFNGKEMTIVNIRPLKAGEMVAENYGPIFTHHSLSDRQKKLLSRYWFTCNCEACKYDWPIYAKMTNDIHLRIKPKQSGKNRSKKKKDEKKRTNKELSPEERVNFIVEAHKHFDQAVLLMEGGKREEAIAEYCKWVDVASQEVQLPLKDLHLSKEALRLLVGARGSIYLENKP